jgi:hypothetical protein
MANSYIVAPLATDKYKHILNTHSGPTGPIIGPNKWYNHDLPAIAHTYTYTRPLSPAFETALRHLLLNPPNHAHLFYFARRAVIMLFGFDERFVDTFRPANMQVRMPTATSVARDHEILFWDTDASTHMFYIILRNDTIELRYRGPRPPPSY